MEKLLRSPGTVQSLLFLCVVWPLLFGVPAHAASGTGSDANFALTLVKDYIAAVHAGQWFPRWLPQENFGYGSPLFYFYGRLPFLIAALLGTGLHLSAQAAMLLCMGLFRLCAYFTCRLWLRLHVSETAANWGALLFVCLPFGMLYNPLDRVGFSEVAATGIAPLVLYYIDRSAQMTGIAKLRFIGLLGLIYAALAATHLPQTLLVFEAATLYALLLCGIKGFMVQCIGAACGLFASASSVLPAVLLQKQITPAAWRDVPVVAMQNNFLFSMSRYRLHTTLSSECYLYATWLLCASFFVAMCLLIQRKHGTSSRWKWAVLVAGACSLLAMTKLGWPLWMYVPEMKTIQFPWRLFPLTMCFAAGAFAWVLIQKPKIFLFAASGISLLIGTEALIPLTGFLATAKNIHSAAALPKSILYRLPVYLPWSIRETKPFLLPRSSPPEYLTADASRDGWHYDPSGDSLTFQGKQPLGAQIPADLQVLTEPNGSVNIAGDLEKPTSIRLHSFYFPDMKVFGNVSAHVAPDVDTALAMVYIPAGSISLHLNHEQTPVPSRLAIILDWIGAALILACVFPWKRLRADSPRA